MKKIKFHYFSNNYLSSILIKLRLGSHFSHVGIELDDGRYFDATGKGCKFRKLPSNMVETQTIEVSDERYEQVVNFIEEQNGKGYDFLAFLGFAVGTKTQDSDRWFCSEISRVVFELATGKQMKHYTLLSPGEMRYLVAGYLLA